MRQNRRKKVGLWAIALAISGTFFSFHWAWAETSLQISAQHASLTPTFGAYIFPNPVRLDQHPTMMVEPGASDKITARIYDSAGSQIFQTRVDDHNLTSLNTGLAYEVPVTASLKPGVYMGLLLGYQGDRITDRTTFRFSVVK